MDKQLIAHELWAAAQLVPGEGIADGAQRIADILERIDAERGKEAVAIMNPQETLSRHAFIWPKDAADHSPDYNAPVFLSPTIPEGMALDAARYRWLRDFKKDMCGRLVFAIEDGGAGMDAEIDSAMIAAAQGERK